MRRILQLMLLSILTLHPAMVQSAEPKAAAPKTYTVTGVVREINPDGKTIVVKHEKIEGYMAAMTMPFEAHDTDVLRGIKSGDKVSFRLLVTENDNWIDQVRKAGAAGSSTNRPPATPAQPTKHDHK